MRYLAVIVAVLAFAGTAQAGGQSNAAMCKTSWSTAQSGSGQVFSSRADCQKAKEMYTPSVALGAAHVNANEAFTITGAGFHANAQITATGAITGQAPYYTFPGLATDAAGATSAIGVFSGCGTTPPYDITITLTDSYGVHASARITVC